MPKKVTCHRNHSAWHQVQTVKLLKNGKTREMKECHYILGCTGVESKGFKTILCCDIPKGQPIPANILQIDSI